MTARARVRSLRVVSLCVLTSLLILPLAVGRASAQGIGAWTINCKGTGAGAVSWTWLLNGAPIANAGGSTSCSGTAASSGTNAPPANANGVTLTVSAMAGDKEETKFVTKSFAAGSSVEVKGAASASDRFCVEIIPRQCLFVTNAHEGIHFSLDG